MGQSATRVGVAILMAVTAPLSGVPHFDCVCPDGHRKPFCSGRPSADTGCCCGTSCCQSTREKKCCCRAEGRPQPGATGSDCCGHRGKRERRPDAPAGGSEIVRGGCCHLTLVPAEELGAAPAGSEAAQHLTGWLAAPLHQAEFATLVPSSGHGRPCGHDLQRPPPTDLVITLRHLTI